MWSWLLLAAFAVSTVLAQANPRGELPSSPENDLSGEIDGPRKARQELTSMIYNLWRKTKRSQVYVGKENNRLMGIPTEIKRFSQVYPMIHKRQIREQDNYIDDLSTSLYLPRLGQVQSPYEALSLPNPKEVVPQAIRSHHDRSFYINEPNDAPDEALTAIYRIIARA